VSGQQGSAGGILDPGSTAVVDVVLETTFQLSGTVVYPGGSPASGVVVEWKQGGNFLYTETGGDGHFVFNATPTGSYTLNLKDPIGPGLAWLSGTLLANTDLGTITLDDGPPHVLSVVPVPGAVEVPLDTAIKITFSEAVNPGTVDSTHIQLTGPEGTVTGFVTLEAGDTVALFTPLDGLQDEARYTLLVSGVEDSLGRAMTNDFTASFTTVDITPPEFMDIGPAPGTAGVSTNRVIRITYTEPVDLSKLTGPAIKLTTDAGPVTGRTDWILGNTGVVFTPDRPLTEDTTYHVMVSPVSDLAGNQQTTGLDYTFTTTDRTPPEIQSLNLSDNGTVIQGATAAVTAETGATDVAFVDFFLNGNRIQTDRNPPYTFTFVASEDLGLPGGAIQVAAMATDTSGNTGAQVAGTFTIMADRPPTVTITYPADGTTVTTGGTVQLTVQATDDLGISTLGWRASGVPLASGTVSIDPATAAIERTFTFTVPADTQPGTTLTLEATALDTRGQTGKAISVGLSVRDATAPEIQFSGLTTGDKVFPGETVTAVVDTRDLGGISSVTLSVSGAVVLSETRPISPAQDSVVTTFTFTIPATAGPLDRVILEATAVDQAGNSSTTPRVLLPVADTIPPTVTLSTETGGLEVLPGQGIRVIARATDEIGVSQIELTGTGAWSVSDAKAVSPPLGEASVTFDIAVPQTAQPGDTLTLEAVALDTSGNRSDPANLTITVIALPDVTMPASTVLLAGDTTPVELQLSLPAPAGGMEVTLASEDTTIATVTPSVVIPEGQTLGTFTLEGVSGGSVSIDVTIQGFLRGRMTVTVQGGVVSGTVYNPFPTPVVGAEVNINGVITTTGSDGTFQVTGITGPYVTIRAHDPATGLQGYFAGDMNRANGYLRDVGVALVPAGSIQGQVVLPDGVTPVGSGVQVDLFASGDLSSPLQTLFTDGNGRFEFPLVAVGDYVLEARDTSGNQGRVQAFIANSGDVVDLTLAFLGKGTVTGTVLDGFGNPVANATISLSSSSIFYGNFTATTDLNGVFTIQDIFVGPFSVQARDDVTGLGASTTGEITAHGETVAVTLRLAAWASIEGTIYRPDGVTPVAGAQVDIMWHGSTVSDSTGHYRLDILPLATLTVNAIHRDSRSAGHAVVTLNTAGEVRQADIILSGQGGILVKVVDGLGQPVEGARVTVLDSLAGTLGSIGGDAGPFTGPDGTVLVQPVAVGVFTVIARSGTLNGTATGTVADGAVASVTVQLTPTATITGTVYEPDGVTPAAGVRVNLIWDRYWSVARVDAGPDGTFRFDNIPLGDHYGLSVYINGHLRSLIDGRSDRIILDTAGGVVTQNLTLIGTGNVTGRVVLPGGASASDFIVTVQSPVPDFGRTETVRTDAGGFYRVEDLPVGPFTVSTGDLSLKLLGEGSGTIATHGETVTVNILLKSNAVTLPVNLYDGNHYRYDLQEDGVIRTGHSQGAGIFYGPYTLPPGVLGGAALKIVSGGNTYTFSSGSFAVEEDGGREIVFRQDGLGGVNVTRKIYVPKHGYFARYLEIFTNPGATSVTITPTVISDFYRDGSNISVVDSSSGDAILDGPGTASGDQWVVIDDGNVSSGRLPTAFLWEGQNGDVKASDLVFTPWTGTGSPARLTTAWGPFTLQPGESAAILHFVIQQSSREAARASAERLIEIPPEALSGLSQAELAMVRNFSLPVDGTSTLDPLPPVTGSVSGAVFAADGTTPVPGAEVTLRSDLIYFSRSYVVGTSGDNTFTLDITRIPYEARNQAEGLIPLAGFTLTARFLSQDSLPVAGTFPAGSATATQDVSFTNMGLLTGSVRTPAGDPVAGASVGLHLSGTNYSATTGADGTYLFRVIPPGTYTVSMNWRGKDGNFRSIQIPGVVLPAGTGTTLDFTADETPPAVQIDQPVDGSLVVPGDVTLAVTATDDVGITSLTLDVGGAVTYHETVDMGGGTSISHTFTFPLSISVQPGSALTLTVRGVDAVGNEGTATVNVTVADIIPPEVTLVFPASGSTDVPVALPYVEVTFSEPVTGMDGATFRLEQDDGTGGLIPVAGTVQAISGTQYRFIPGASLAYDTLYTIHITGGAGGVADQAGNSLAGDFLSTFRTKPPDLTPPGVSVVSPADGATDVPVRTNIRVTFTEPVDPATVDGTTFSVTAGGSPVSGTLTLLNGDQTLQFLPDAPFAFGTMVEVSLTSGIRDLAGNPLADAAGKPLTAPLTYTFTTGQFAIVKPVAGEGVVEETAFIIEARASASLGVNQVVFTVGGKPFPAVSGPPFVAQYTAPTAADVPELVITAEARKADGTVLGQDSITVPVVRGLRIIPSITGIPSGGEGILMLNLSSPRSADLVVTLQAADNTKIAFPVNPVTIPAGETSFPVRTEGLTSGSTTVTATSDLGTTAAIVSVSQPVPGSTISLTALPVGVSVHPVRSAGQVILKTGSNMTLSVPLLDQPASMDLAATAISDHPEVADVTGNVQIPQGSRDAILNLTTGTIGGTASIRIQSGNHVRVLTVIVGTPPAGTVPPVISPAAGVFVHPPRSAGRVILGEGRNITLTIPMVDQAVSTDTVVAAISGDASVAAINRATIPAGSKDAVIGITTGTAGTTTITLQAGDTIKILTVIVGLPPAGEIPPVIAPPVGIFVRPPRSAGRVILGAGSSITLTIPMVDQAVSTDTVVAAISGDAGIAAINSATIPAGSKDAVIGITTGTAGTTTITLQAGDHMRILNVTVGTPPAGREPPVTAPVVGVEVVQ